MVLTMKMEEGWCRRWIESDEFSKTDNIYTDAIWDPMVIVRNERYMFVQHVPIMYLTYTYHLSLIFLNYGVHVGYILGIC